MDKLALDPGIVRNRAKVSSAMSNATEFLAVKKEFRSFDAYCWQFVGGRQRQNRWSSQSGIPATTAELNAFSRDPKRCGFNFVGTTVIYAHMQAVGMVNDHMVNCFRYREVRKIGIGGRR